MNKVVFLTLIGMMALLTQSCSLFSNFADPKKEQEENAAQPIPVQIDPALTQTEEAEEFADLKRETEPNQEVAGLIPATNPDIRARTSVRGRQDPFSVVNLTPRIAIKEQEKTKQAKNSNQNQNQNQNNNGLSSNANLNGGSNQDSNGSINANLNGDSNQNSNDSINDNSSNFIPPPPDSTLAESVIVSGLYQGNGKAKLIVKAPEEDTSRYVEVGQYLSNGQILVKSIDLNSSPTPRVILEQSGVEVTKEIGESPENSNGNNISSLPTDNSRNGTLLSNASLGLK